tara:strand:- start:12827 stop:13231 length:405 start_codon:yes stop_codon:yes gene_type:complete
MKSLLSYVDNELLTESSFSSRSLDIVLGGKEVDSLPVSVSESEWTTLSSPERLGRVFKFRNPSLLREFISQILKHQESVGHHADIEIKNRNVKIESYTHDVDAVTELDIELTKFIDDLYDDLQYYLSNIREKSI